jgi:hypothetical protein
MADTDRRSIYVLKKKYFLSKKTVRMIKNDEFLNVF